MIDKLLKKFSDNKISMWNPNTNYLVYFNHLKKILDYCLEHKDYRLNYQIWLDILNSDNVGSKIGRETHNVCQGLNIIESEYLYRTEKEYNMININIPRELLYQYVIDNRNLTDEFYNIIAKRYFNLLRQNNIFKMENLEHVQRVALNLFVCYLKDTNKFNDQEIVNYINFARSSSNDVANKLNKVYLYDICKENSNLLEKLKISFKHNDSINTKTFLESLFQSLVEESNNVNVDEFTINDSNRIVGAYNKIFYGVPGCGKSYIVNKEFNKDVYNIERTTFHPEYTNSDFVGQIIPKLKDNNVLYEFHPGAFAKSLLYSLVHPNEKVCLIIEEINRGNASSIFGDIFQLLDRDLDGNSIYSIFNGPLLDYLNENGVFIKEIFIPSNMWIVATMNTCDQNVFTLDTAFKRRWKMEYIKNVFGLDKESQILMNTKIPFNGRYNTITWGEFVTKINKHILADKSGINSEDKQLGMYFVSVDEINSSKEFSEKILSYLWEDVAKLNTEYWFGDISSYEELLNKYDESYLMVFDTLFDEEINKIQDITNIGLEQLIEGE